jgi:hypothetical protein
MSPPTLRPTVSEEKINRHRTRANVRHGGTGPQENSRARDRQNGPWGEKLSYKATEAFRYCFANINGLPSAAYHEKHDQITQSMIKHKMDVLGIAEININFQQVGPTNQWKDRFKQQRTNSHCATNQHTTSKDKRVFGGTAYLTSPSASHKVEQKGEDPTKLGRWTWALLTGKQGIKTRIISGYRPIHDATNRVGTVYSQHQKHFNDIKSSKEPRQGFLDDLKNAITTWRQQGELIILGLDLNDNTWDSDEANQIESWGLINALKDRHPDLAPVATCNKNNRNKPIDGIWCSPGIDILQAGMTGFGSPNMGSMDHRLLWIDLSVNSIFGYRPPPLAPISQVGIPMRNPAIGLKFNVKLRKARNKHNIPNQILWLEQRAKDGIFDQHDAQQFETVIKLDDELREACKKSIRKKYAGQVPYSDVIGKDRTEIRMWKLVIKRLQNQRTDTRKIRRLMNKVEIPNALRLTFDEAIKAQKACYTRYKTNKNKAAELRKEFQHKVNTNRAIKYGTSVETQEKITKHAFQSKCSFARIRKVIQKNPREAITYVEYTDEFGINQECVNKDEIDQACIKEGYRRYAQAQDTPFLTAPLLNDFGFLDNQANVQKVLDGTYECPEELDEFTKKFIRELKQPETIQQHKKISGFTTTKDHIKSWKKMRVHTAASTFGPSFSEIITGTEDETIAEVDAATVSIAALTGYCPKRWSDAIDVMIPKKAASKHVEKLRIIVLFHSLFNMLNKKVAKQAMTQAKQLGVIPSEAYAKQGFRAVDCGLNKVLTADILRQHHLPAALCSNDAKQCYDRIVHAIAIICLQRIGIDENTCRVMFGSLQQMQHYVKTAYGLSKTSYGCIEIPLQGVLQGNGAGPAIWLLTSIAKVSDSNHRTYLPTKSITLHVIHM